MKTAMMDLTDIPTITVLCERAHVARKPRECNVCKETIEPGQRYESTGMIYDGKFEHWVRHEFGERYPSGCPKYRERDEAEAEEQYHKDAAIWNAPARWADPLKGEAAP